MAENERPNANTLAAPFPPPPFFYKSFTQENLTKLAELRSAQETKDGSQPSSSKSTARGPPTLPTRVLDLPPELLFLQPPLPPKDGLYGAFGERFTLKEELPTLAEKGIQQLYEISADTPSSSPHHHDLKFVLQKLTKSLLLNFMELMGVMSVNPEQGETKLDDIRTHFINIHHLLNQYRPHQARESLILLMEDQVARANAETEGIYAMKKKVEGVLDGFKSLEIPGEEKEDGKAGGANGGGEDDNTWEEMEKRFS